jgi:hypothetical protein
MIVSDDHLEDREGDVFDLALYFPDLHQLIQNPRMMLTMVETT